MPDGMKLSAVGGLGILPSYSSVYTSPDWGTTWRSNSAPAIAWSSIASSADGTRLVAARLGGGIYTSMDSGSTWVPNSAPLTNWICVASSADGARLVAVVQGGGIYSASFALAPALNVARAGANLAFSWIIPSTPLVLLQSTALEGTNWVQLPNTPTVDLTKLQNEVLLSPSNNRGFYRLASP